MGGVGFMSHSHGLQAGHVSQLEVVTGRGDLVVCSNDVNKDLFEFCRSGLGQFGIITEVVIPLIKAPKQIAIFKFFYRQSSTADFMSDMTKLVDDGRYDNLHAFLKPCTGECISGLVGKDKYTTASGDFFEAIKDGESKGEVVYFLEVGCYLWDKVDDEQDASAFVDDLRTGLRDLNGLGECFEEVFDYYNYITRDPPVVKTNKEHGGQIPHPSMATFIGRDHFDEFVSRHLSS